MPETTLTIDAVLIAARRHLAERHVCTNPEYPVLRIHVTEFTFVDRTAGITPRQHLVLEGEQWRFV